MMRGHAIHEEEAELREADDLVCGHRYTLGLQAFADVVGVVTVQYQQSHDPEDIASLEYVIVVVIVCILLQVGPGMPGWGENENEDDKVRAGWVLREVFGEIGYEGHVYVL